MPPSVSFFLISTLLAATTVQAAVSTVNSTAAHEDMVICIYPLSGQYGFLPRVLYYFTLVFAILGRNQQWLVVGALASALTYSGCAAIHILCLSGSRTPIYDLDILGCWALLSTGALAFVVMIHWSTTVKQSRAKVVLVLWAVLMGIGLSTGRALLFDRPLRPEPSCRSKSGQLLQLQSQLLDPAFNCTYKCFSADKVMRKRNEKMAIPSTYLNLRDPDYIVLLGPIMAAALKCLSYQSLAHSPSQLCSRTIISKLINNQGRHKHLTDHIYDAAASKWYGGYIILIQYIHRQPWSWHHLWIWSLAYPWLALELVLDALTPPMFIANIVLNELNLRAQNLPNAELPYAVGQWSPMASTLLVIMASAVCRGIEIWENRKKVDIPREDGPTHPTVAV
jgi:hypothetical protein